MFDIEGINITSLAASARGVRIESVESTPINQLTLKQLLASANGSTGVEPDLAVFNPTNFVPAEAVTAAQIWIEASAAIDDRLEVRAVNVSTYTTRHPNTPVDLPGASAAVLQADAFVTDQNANVVAPTGENYVILANEQITATIKQGFGGLKARGAGDSGFQIRNPQTRRVWLSSNDIVWSSADFFIVNGGTDTTKTYDWLEGREVLVTQSFTGTPTSTRKMLQMNTSWTASNQQLRVWGGSERTLIMVFSR